MSKTKRDIAAITGELQTVLGRERIDIITIGGLLIEAQDQLEHGAWLPWLKENFGSSERTATNYMNAARFAAKSATVADLKLRPTALYLLGDAMDEPDGLFTPKAVKAILKAAKTEWISADQARAIAYALKPHIAPAILEQQQHAREEAQRAFQEQITAREQAKQAKQKEVDDLLDGPPPELPPAPEIANRDPDLAAFDQAVATLARLQTKLRSSFHGTSHSSETLADVAWYLRAIGDDIGTSKSKPSHPGVQYEDAETQKKQQAEFDEMIRRHHNRPQEPVERVVMIPTYKPLRD